MEMKIQKEKLYLDFRKLSDLKSKGVLNLPIEVIESINVCLKYGVVSPKDLKLDDDCKHSKRRYSKEFEYSLDKVQRKWIRRPITLLFSPILIIAGALFGAFEMGKQWFDECW